VVVGRWENEIGEGGDIDPSGAPPPDQRRPLEAAA
jgi:hypothetical protein